jgi:hypothetical protein
MFIAAILISHVEIFMIFCFLKRFLLKSLLFTICIPVHPMDLITEAYRQTAAKNNCDIYVNPPQSLFITFAFNDFSYGKNNNIGKRIQDEGNHYTNLPLFPGVTIIPSRQNKQEWFKTEDLCHHKMIMAYICLINEFRQCIPNNETHYALYGVGKGAFFIQAMLILLATPENYGTQLALSGINKKVRVQILKRITFITLENPIRSINTAMQHSLVNPFASHSFKMIANSIMGYYKVKTYFEWLRFASNIPYIKIPVNYVCNIMQKIILPTLNKASQSVSSTVTNNILPLITNNFDPNWNRWIEQKMNTSQTREKIKTFNKKLHIACITTGSFKFSIEQLAEWPAESYHWVPTTIPNITYVQRLCLNYIRQQHNGPCTNHKYDLYNILLMIKNIEDNQGAPDWGTKNFPDII